MNHALTSVHEVQVVGASCVDKLWAAISPHQAFCGEGCKCKLLAARHRAHHAPQRCQIQHFRDCEAATTRLSLGAKPIGAYSARRCISVLLSYASAFASLHKLSFSFMLSVVLPFYSFSFLIFLFFFFEKCSFFFSLLIFAFAFAFAFASASISCAFALHAFQMDSFLCLDFSPLSCTTRECQSVTFPACNLRASGFCSLSSCILACKAFCFWICVPPCCYS